MPELLTQFIKYLARSGVIASCCVITLSMISCRDSYWVQLSGPVTLGNEWTELRPKSPLKADKTFQWLQLYLEPPFKDDLDRQGNGPNQGKGILMPDGEALNPEIEIIDENGNAFSLVYGGGSGIQLPNYDVQPPNKLPQDRSYKVVRIRSARPIKLKAIYWYCESSKDWK
jgi:hypothetical protein